MCSRYYFDSDTMNGIMEIVEETDARLREVRADRDIRPTDTAAVIIRGRCGTRLSGIKWGYPGVKGSGVVINARAESVTDRRMFTNGIRHRRAVVPARHFYEWSRNREKNTFRRKDGDTIYMAGFYDLTDAGERFVIITTQANESMARVHDRMPLILEKGQIRDWLTDDAAVSHFLRQTPVLLDRETEYEQQTLSGLM